MGVRAWLKWRRMRNKGYRRSWGRIILDGNNRIAGFFYGGIAYLYEEVLKKIWVWRIRK